MVFKYKDKKTGAVILVESELKGDWELVEEEKEKVTEEEVTEEKPTKKKSKKDD